MRDRINLLVILTLRNPASVRPSARLRGISFSQIGAATCWNRSRSWRSTRYWDLFDTASLGDCQLSLLSLSDLETTRFVSRLDFWNSIIIGLPASISTHCLTFSSRHNPRRSHYFGALSATHGLLFTYRMHGNRRRVTWVSSSLPSVSYLPRWFRHSLSENMELFTFILWYAYQRIWHWTCLLRLLGLIHRLINVFGYCLNMWFNPVFSTIVKHNLDPAEVLRNVVQLPISL